MATRFDVAVVGAGAAGCVVAARLTEDPACRVVLVEAGPEPPDDDALHDGWRLPRPPDWGFASEPVGDRDAEPLRRSKLVGGTSWLTRFALRGAPGDADAWAGLGNPGWSFEEVLPAFRRLERDEEYGDRPWHGSDGPLPVTRYPALAPGKLLAALVDAGGASGFPDVADHNEPGAVGLGPMPMSSDGGRRVTTSSAWLAPARGRPNLDVRTDAPVAEVTFEGTRANGVRLLDGTLVEAERVVLCAGTYGSPAILLRSGLGPAVDLGVLGIPVRADLPGVGSNLADHPGADVELAWDGPLRAAPMLHAAATFHARATPDAEPPDLMLWLSDPPALPATIDVVLLRPRARGRVRLRSADPSDPPRIRLPDAVGDPSDLERLVEGTERAIELANHPSVRLVSGGRGPVAPTGGRDDLRRHVTANPYSVPHVVGTCAMEPSPEAGGVVDQRGRVHGTDGLFVADASIIPLPPSGFTHLPTIMVAERIGEWLVADPSRKGRMMARQPREEPR